MSDTLEVLPVGSEVLIDGDILARVTAIMITDSAVTYQCLWWNNRDRKIEWFDLWEIKPNDEEARKLRVDPVL